MSKSKVNIKTNIKLDREYNETSKCNDCEIVSPDGKKKWIYNYKPSKVMKEYIEYTHGDINPLSQERKTKSIKIAGYKLEQIAPNHLAITSKDSKIAGIRYRKIRAELITKKYKVSHWCEEIPKEQKHKRSKCPPSLPETFNKINTEKK